MMNGMVLLYLFVMGAAIGSFLNVLIDRLPNEESINGRSRCDYCKKQLPWSVNIPVISYFLLHGRTRCCHKSLSFQYPLIELITGLMFVGVWMIFPMQSSKILNFKFLILNEFQILTLEKIAVLGLFSTLLVIFVADLKYHIIPDSMQILLLVFSVILSVGTGRDLSLLNILVSGAIIMSPILFLFLITLGRGMGFGDVKFAFTMGVLLGTVGGIIALYIAFVTGAVVGVFLMLMKKRGMKSKIAFGPFLVIGLVTVLLFQEQLLMLVHRFYP